MFAWPALSLVSTQDKDGHQSLSMSIGNSEGQTTAKGNVILQYKIGAWGMAWGVIRYQAEGERAPFQVASMRGLSEIAQLPLDHSAGRE